MSVSAFPAGQNDFYEREEELAFAYADVVREEIGDLFAAGADVVQLDEPWMEARPQAARRLALPTLERALDGVRGTRPSTSAGYPAFVPDHPPAFEPSLTSRFSIRPTRSISTATTSPSPSSS
jgi:5-methyltetrahydropteroyltriglutamate--homocysteine methyltransferase